MRILYVAHQFFPEFRAGTERVTLNLARAAQRAGHAVHVLACAMNPPASWRPSEHVGAMRLGSWDGVAVGVIARDALPPTGDTGFDVDERLERELRAWMLQHRFDVVHVMHTMRMSTAVLAAQRAGLPLVVTATDFFLPCLRVNLVDVEGRLCEGPDEGRRCAERCATPTWTAAAFAARWAQARAMIAAAHVRVAPSRYVAARYEAAFPGLDWHVVAHGVDVLATLDAAPLPGLPDGPGPLLAYVGTLVEAKGLQVLLQAMARVPALPLRLVIAGTAPTDDLYVRDIDRLVAADPRVRRLGALSGAQVASLMRAIDLLCVPSLVPESFSLVLHEAAAAGVPALVSALGAPADVVAAHGGGAAVRAGDVAAWAAALQALADDPSCIDRWRAAVPLPLRLEEEAFLYESLYRLALGPGRLPAAAP